MINYHNASLNYHKFQSIIYVSNSGQSYENHSILNVYNFLYRTYFENLIGNLIKKQSYQFIFFKFYFFKKLKDF